jgi:hypothetical protein
MVDLKMTISRYKIETNNETLTRTIKLIGLSQVLQFLPDGSAGRCSCTQDSFVTGDKSGPRYCNE